VCGGGASRFKASRGRRMMADRVGERLSK
jgi:hypothetical protein